MKLGILGAGGVEQALAEGWRDAGHDVTVGSRAPGERGDLGFPVGEVPEVAGAAELVVNATPGAVSLEVIEALHPNGLQGKILLDLANANTSSFELVYPNSSLGELLLRALPGTRMVKTLNTFSAKVMTGPRALESSSVFLPAMTPPKETVAGLLEDLGWPHESLMDLGGIESARGPEHYFLMFASLPRALNTPIFNRVVS